MGDRSADELAAALGIPAVAVRRVAAAVGLEDGEAGEDTDWAFLQLLGALARVRPLVIVVDDAHWAEPALLDLLLDAAGAPARRAGARRLGRAPGPARAARRWSGAPSWCCSRCRPTASESLLAAMRAAGSSRARSAGSSRRRAATRCSSSSSSPTSASGRCGGCAPPGAAGPARGSARRARRDGALRAGARPRSRATGSTPARSTRSPRGSRAPTWSGRASGSSSATCWCATSADGAAVPPHADPRRRVRVAGQVGAGAAARAARRVARGAGTASRRPTRGSASTSRRACRFAARDRRRRAARARGAGGRAARGGRRALAHGRGDLAGRDRLPRPCGGAARRRRPEGAALLPDLVSALLEAGDVRAGGGARRPRGVGERVARPRARPRPRDGRARAGPALVPPRDVPARASMRRSPRRRPPRCASSATSWGLRARPS